MAELEQHIKQQQQQQQKRHQQQQQMIRLHRGNILIRFQLDHPEVYSHVPKDNKNSKDNSSRETLLNTTNIDLNYSIELKQKQQHLQQQQRQASRNSNNNNNIIINNNNNDDVIVDDDCLASCFPNCQKPTYQAGQCITGCVVIRPVYRMKISGVYVKIWGHVGTKWRDDDDDGGGRIISASNWFYQQNVSIVRNRITNLNTEWYKYDFEYKLPANLPPSFKMSDGSRKYYACAVVSQSNGPDIESYQVGFKLVGGLAFDSSPWYLAEPFEMKFSSSRYNPQKRSPPSLSLSSTPLSFSTSPLIKCTCSVNNSGVKSLRSCVSRPTNKQQIVQISRSISFSTEEKFSNKVTKKTFKSKLPEKLSPTSSLSFESSSSSSSSSLSSSPSCYRFINSALSIFDQIICPFPCKFRCCCWHRCRSIRQKSVDRSKPIALKKLHLNENLSNQNIDNRNINDVNNINNCLSDTSDKNRTISKHDNHHHQDHHHHHHQDHHHHHHQDHHHHHQDHHHHHHDSRCRHLSDIIERCSLFSFINQPFLTEPLTSAVDINYVTTFGSVSGSFCINRRVFIPRDEAHVTCSVDNHSSRDLVCSISLHQVISFRADHCEGGSEEDSSRKVLFMKRHMQLQQQPIKEVTKITDNNLIQTSNLSVQAGDSTSFGFRFQVPANLTYSDASSFNCDDGSKKSSESSSQALLNASSDVVDDVIVIRYFCMLQILPTKEKTKVKEKYLAPIEVWMARR